MQNPHLRLHLKDDETEKAIPFFDPISPMLDKQKRLLAKAEVTLGDVDHVSWTATLDFGTCTPGVYRSDKGTVVKIETEAIFAETRWRQSFEAQSPDLADLKDFLENILKGDVQPTVPFPQADPRDLDLQVETTVR